MAEIENAPPMPEVKKRRHWRLSMVILVCLVSCGNTAQAYSAGVIATTFGQPSFISYMGLDKMKNASSVMGATGSLFYAGGFFGSLLSNWISDRYGRRMTILVGLLVVLISTALCTASQHIAMFIVFRFTCGFGALMLNMAVPLWVTECVPPEVRGAFAQISSSAVTFGYFLSSYIGVGFFLNLQSGANVWRGPLGIGCAFCLPLLAGLWWVPESPRYLLLKGCRDEAREVVLKLHATPHDHSHQFAELELYQMERQIELERTLESSWLALLKRPSYRKRMMMSVFLVFTIQATGSQILIIYGSIIYSSLGFSPTKTLLLQAAIFAVNWPISAFAVFWTEKFQRPRMLATGILGMATMLSCYAGLTANYLGTDNRSAQIAATCMTFFFFAFYASCAEGPFYYYSSEIFPTHLRAKGATLQSTTFSWTSILWAQVGPVAIANIGWRFFLVCICLTAFGGIIVLFFYPDTQGKTLEEIAGLFGDTDLVEAYQRDIDLGLRTEQIVASSGEGKLTQTSV